MPFNQDEDKAARRSPADTGAGAGRAARLSSRWRLWIPKLRRCAHALWVRVVALVLIALCLAVASCLLPGFGALLDHWMRVATNGRVPSYGEVAPRSRGQGPGPAMGQPGRPPQSVSNSPNVALSQAHLPTSAPPSTAVPTATVAAQQFAARSVVLGAALVVASFLALAWPGIASSGAATLVCLVLLSWFAAGAAGQWRARSPALVVSLACMAGLAWLFAHLAYLTTLYTQSALESDQDAGDGLLERLLPSQRALVGTLTDLILGEARPSQPTMISLRGAWGSGKSTIVAGLVAQLRRDHAERAVVVYVDAWQHQADANLEQALFRAIAARRELLWPRAWLAYPVFSDILFLFFKAVRLSMVRGGFKAELDSRSAAPPVIWWRRRLRQIIDPATRVGRRIVVVLDEVDRCEPLAAQAFLTLVPRFLLMPGVVVVVPTVKQQVGFKVFTPLTAGLPDLRSTMDAVLYAELAPERQAELHAELRASVTAGRACAPGEPVGAAGADAPAPARHQPDGAEASRASALDSALLRQYLQLDDLERRRLAFMFAEKFFASTPVHIPPLTVEDVCGVLDSFHGVRQALAAYHLSTDEHAHLLEWATSEWQDGLARVSNTFGSLRQLQGALAANLNDLAQRTQAPVPPAGVALRDPGMPPAAQRECDALTAAQLAVTLAIRSVVFGRLAAIVD